MTKPVCSILPSSRFQCGHKNFTYILVKYQTSVTNYLSRTDMFGFANTAIALPIMVYEKMTCQPIKIPNPDVVLLA
jgi:hypothetical protein